MNSRSPYAQAAEEKKNTNPLHSGQVAYIYEYFQYFNRKLAFKNILETCKNPHIYTVIVKASLLKYWLYVAPAKSNGTVHIFES